MKTNTALRSSILLLFFMCAAYIAAAIPPRKVTGKVCDSATSAPIKNVIVTNRSDSVRVLSDREGRYTLNARQGDTLAFYRPGYAPQKIKITAPQHDIRLHPAPITTLEEMLMMKMIDDTLPKSPPMPSSKEVIRIRGNRKAPAPVPAISPAGTAAHPAAKSATPRNRL